MAITSLSHVYSFSYMYTGTNAYDAKNTVAKAWADDFAAATIPGLTLYALVSPDVSTTAGQTFSVMFTTSQGYRIEYYLQTSCAANVYLTVRVFSTIGVSTNAGTTSTTMTSSGSQASIAFDLIRYFSAENYDIYATSGIGNINAYTPIGAVYLNNRSPSAPEVIITHHLGSGATGTNPVTGAVVYTIGGLLGYKSTTGEYAICDAPIYETGGALIGTGKNCKTAGTSLGAGASPYFLVAAYSINGDTYIRIGYGYLLLKVT